MKALLAKADAEQDASLEISELAVRPSSIRMLG
jgi:hypothetical protein